MLTPFGAVYPYDDYDGAESLNRAERRTLLKFATIKKFCLQVSAPNGVYIYNADCDAQESRDGKNQSGNRAAGGGVGRGLGADGRALVF
jgi:hypothetical protein